MKRPNVYILECKNGKLYVGVTSDLDGRLWEHENGTNDGFTKRNRPCKLVWNGEFQTMSQAIDFEKQVKGWRREKKVALIEGRFEDLPELATPYNERTSPPCSFDPLRMTAGASSEGAKHDKGNLLNMTITLRDRIASDHAYLSEIRHDLHAHPELMYQEKRTCEVVQRELKAAGIEFTPNLAGGTGVLGFIPATEKNAKTVALRADMDALPILEETGLPYASTNPGVMHACGHDGHTTILLGAARALQNETTRKNNVLLMFQPAEEGGAGGKRMCEDGVLNGSIYPAKADVAYGLHGWPLGKEGVFGVKNGAMLAATDQFVIHLQSPGGHAAAPHVTVDTIVASAQIIVALQTIASRNIVATEGFIMTVTYVKGGNALNVIPSKVEMGGTMRTLTPESREKGKQRFFDVVQGVGRSLGVDVEIEWEEGYPVTFNDAWATDRYRRIAATVIGEQRMKEESAPVMGGEDFSFYGQHVPACFFFVGLCPLDKERVPSVHTPLFDFNDRVIPDAVETMCRLALDPVD